MKLGNPYRGTMPYTVLGVAGDLLYAQSHRHGWTYHARPLIIQSWTTGGVKVVIFSGATRMRTDDLSIQNPTREPLRHRDPYNHSEWVVNMAEQYGTIWEPVRAVCKHLAFSLWPQILMLPILYCCTPGVAFLRLC